MSAKIFEPLRRGLNDHDELQMSWVRVWLTSLDSLAKVHSISEIETVNWTLRISIILLKALNINCE